MKTDYAKLDLWRRRLADNAARFAAETGKMDARERMYRGDNTITPTVTGDKTTKAAHVRNICAEMVESTVSSSIPQPKVTAKRKKDEHLAKIIEDMLRNEIDNLGFRQLNDMMERTVPIQGGAAFLVEWDNTKRDHYTVGELCVSSIHPKQIVPQDGVYTGIEDMDYIILKIPQTKEYIRNKYGIDVDDQNEEFIDVKGTDSSSAKDMVTQCVAYYRNSDGGIGIYSWVNNTQIEDIEDYQARHSRKCSVCGAPETDAVQPMDSPTMDGNPIGEPGKREKGVCPYCGSTKWESSSDDWQEVFLPISLSDGTQIPGEHAETEIDELGNQVVNIVPTKIPYYKPDIYPVILIKNVSVFGKLLGDSDIDKLESYQNSINRMETKISEKLIKSGSYITLPPDASIKHNAEDMKVIYPRSAADMAQIAVFNLEGNIEQDLAYEAQLYEEAKQVIGVTDSYLGRTDTTATSGKAKEFAAAQSAGRMESRRVMKEAAYAALYEAMFKFKLAYADEPRPVVAQDNRGHAAYEEFNRYDFLEQDDAGEWCWNDRFIFSCDTAMGMASNREAMWQETRNNFQSGAFGNPAELDTLALYWNEMASLHYPGAESKKEYFDQKKQEQMMQQQMLAQQQQMAQMRTLSNGMTGDVSSQIIAKAQQDAAQDAAQFRGKQGIALNQ